MLSAVDETNIANESARADELMREQQQTIYARTDRLFAVLMVLQWLAGIAAAIRHCGARRRGSRQPFLRRRGQANAGQGR